MIEICVLRVHEYPWKEEYTFKFNMLFNLKSYVKVEESCQNREVIHYVKLVFQGKQGNRV